MANMALNIEQRIGQKLTNEQYLIWWHLFNTWPNLTFQPFVYSNNTAGELAVYSVNKLYFAYSFILPTSVAAQNVIPTIIFYDETNAIKYYAANSSSYWDATAAAYRSAALTLNINNYYFSRIGITGAISGFHFIGYKITI